jgi:hypothetical protein
MQVGRERVWEKAWHDKWAAVRKQAKIVMRDHIVDVMELLLLKVELGWRVNEQGVEDGYDTFD